MVLTGTTSGTAPPNRVVAVLGLGQLLAWGSSYYLLAILARPMAVDLHVPAAWVYASFSVALGVAALLGPWSGSRIDRHGGRRVLMTSNGIFALGLVLLALAPDIRVLALGWLVMGIAMPMGLYDAAFSTVVALYGARARRGIVGVTMIAGFASSVSWPLTAVLESQLGWRVACLCWAALHLTAGLWLHGRGVPVLKKRPALHARDAAATAHANAGPPNRALWLLATAFTASGFVFGAMATQLPHLLAVIGCTPAVAVAAASIVGVAQVVARLTEASLLRRLHPLLTGRLAMALHPVGAVLAATVGAPAAFVFTALHGAGIGTVTIVKGTLPLALFGPQGFGRRAGLLEAPARVAQALAPLAFGLMVDRLGGAALWVSATIAALGWLALLAVRLR